jgi:hypothetical protein
VASVTPKPKPASSTSAHSGYFTLRQFLNFAQAKSGKRNAQLVKKLFRSGHAVARRYTRRNLVFQLRARQIYAAIGKDHLRHRRNHELAHVKTRLLALDFILSNPEESYFETPEEKRRYFTESFNADESLFSPLKKGGGGISFSEGFPLYLAYFPPVFSPVITFTYLDPEHRNLDNYLVHLRTYRPLFQRLPQFQFLYVSTASGPALFLSCGRSRACRFDALFRPGNQMGTRTIRPPDRGRCAVLK